MLTFIVVDDVVIRFFLHVVCMFLQLNKHVAKFHFFNAIVCIMYTRALQRFVYGSLLLVYTKQQFC